MLVCQQPLKTQLGQAAERKPFVLKIAEPLPGGAMTGVSFCGEGDSDVDVRQVGHQSRNGRDRIIGRSTSRSPYASEVPDPTLP
jgi:hypothetical protein